MNNNIKKESLDLEAMMNHLDQKADLFSALGHPSLFVPPRYHQSA